MSSQSGKLIPAYSLCTHHLAFLFSSIPACMIFFSTLAMHTPLIAYLFDQQAMRKHLHMCLSTDTFSPFLRRRMGRENKKNKKKARMCTTIHVYCTCRMPASFEKQMIQCAKCHHRDRNQISCSFLYKEMCKKCAVQGSISM